MSSRLSLTPIGLGIGMKRNRKKPYVISWLAKKCLKNRAISSVSRSFSKKIHLGCDNWRLFPIIEHCNCKLLLLFYKKYKMNKKHKLTKTAKSNLFLVKREKCINSVRLSGVSLSVEWLPPSNWAIPLSPFLDLTLGTTIDLSENLFTDICSKQLIPWFLVI